MPELGAGWTVLRSFMRDRCGVQLADEQAYLMDSRLGDIARTLKFGTVDDYVLAACRPGAAATVTGPLIDAMTTHETSFFRDGTFWKAAQDLVLPRVVGMGPLRIWCAACSSGQEPYSLAMLIHERFPALVDRTTIVATDISEGTLATAKAGSFTVFEANRGLTAPRLIRFFERDGVNFRVKPALRNMITWAPHNLVTQGAPAGGPFDLALVRNVLIYFPDAVRQQVLGKVKGSLRPGGCFAIGTSEIISSSWGTALAQGWYAPTV